MAPPRPIKKKLRGYEPYGDPLPVPVASFTGLPSSATSWNYYNGILKDGVVVVSDINHISSLWYNGYFGQLKNPNMSCKDEEQPNVCKIRKSWKLLESNGLKEVSYFKKADDAVKDNTDVESSLCEAKETSKECSSDTMEMQSSPAHSGNQTGSSDVTMHTSHKGISVDCDNEQCVNSSSSDEVNTDYKTVMTLESDHNATKFFEYNDEDSCDGFLELTLEEAMFLSYALGCLIVKRLVHGSKRKSKGGFLEKAMTIDQMWNEFTRDDPKFVVRYYVYHHYRTKGWVVKSGLKFGADYVLYPVGPPFYHAQYTVMIQCVWADNHERDDSLSDREISWMNFAATERMTSHVNKTPLICYVLRPRSLTFSRLSNIICLRSLSIEEVVFSRWDPNAVNNEPDGIITIE
ncbi:tRNA-splicing endonuclease subunit Sen2 [Halocaridina rubra]|uniref:tRNA-splicing endonuclease subunit Sen2 n=1 Tax=Halocaridina rubra TaxID=373956 RepID=A0AAN8WYZ1_HALRR